VGLAGNRRHALCRAYQQFFAHSYDGFMVLSERLAARGSVVQAGEAGAPVLAVGRNDPCPCGSGKKLKQCCGARRPTWLRT
jgi:uncharacterized protein YecA (UPF0149 family)